MDEAAEECCIPLGERMRGAPAIPFHESVQHYQCEVSKHIYNKFLKHTFRRRLVEIVFCKAMKRTR